MRKHSDIAWILAMAALAILAMILLSSCSFVPQGKQVWNPLTWFSGRALTTAQKAEAKEAKAVEKTSRKEDELVHAAHVEVAKADQVLVTATPTPEVALAQRFVRGAAGLLGQVDTITVSERADLVALVADLRSSDAKRVAEAEKRQAAAEARNAALGEQLVRAQASLALARQVSAAKDNKLQEAFERENELADTLRNERVIRWAAVGGVVILAGLCLYLRMGLGSVGAALSGLPSLVGKETAEKITLNLDANTDWLHQILVGSGRKKAEAARQAALLKRAHLSSPTL